MAEGFEPSEGFPSHAFEACSLGRSDTPPPERLPNAAGRARIGCQKYFTRTMARRDPRFGGEVRVSKRVLPRRRAAKAFRPLASRSRGRGSGER